MDKIQRGGHRVLVVDDDPDTSEVLTILFRVLGCETRAVLRGRDALLAARAFDPDVILLDIGLPDINGYQVVQALRAAEHDCHRFIVAVTGWDKGHAQRASRAGFDEHFLKPIDIGTIRAILRARSKVAVERRS